MKHVSLNGIRDVLFYTVILFLPTQFGRHFFPQFSFVEGQRIDYLSPTVFTTDILMMFLFFAVVVGKKRKVFFNAVWHKMFFFILFFLFVGTIFAKNQPVAIYGYGKLLEFIFFGLAVSVMVRDVKKFHHVIILFSVGVIVESILAILEFLHKGSINGIWYFLGERSFNSSTLGIANASIHGELILRPYATFPHPNVLAAYLLIAIIMLISAISFRKTAQKKRVFCFFSLAIGIGALLITLSRAAIVLLIIIGVGTLYRFKKVHRIYALLFFTLIILFIVFSPVLNRFSTLRLSDEALVKREELLTSSFLMIQSHPLLGVGLNNFLVQLPAYYPSPHGLFYLQPVHNIFFLVVAETGIVSLFIFLWFLYKTILHLKNKKQLSLFNVKSQLLLVVILLGCFDHYFLTLQQGQLLFSFVLGLCWSKK